MDIDQIVSDFVEREKEKFIALSDQIWSCPELHFEEYQSSQLLRSALEEEGFQVEAGIVGLATGFVASFGNGKPVVGILGGRCIAGIKSKRRGC